MPPQGNSPSFGLGAMEAVTSRSSGQTKKRSALGIGVTTLVTIMVILLLTAFSVLSLVSAQSNQRLARMATDQAQNYYTADAEATAWYAELDEFVANMSGSASTFSDQLRRAGYQIKPGESSELRVTNGFAINENRTLMVTIQINNDKTTTIRQWQS